VPGGQSGNFLIQPRNFTLNNGQVYFHRQYIFSKYVLRDFAIVTCRDITRLLQIRKYNRLQKSEVQILLCTAINLFRSLKCLLSSEFILDTVSRTCICVHMKMLNQLLGLIRVQYGERFNAKLEKTLSDPIDIYFKELALHFPTGK